MAAQKFHIQKNKKQIVLPPDFIEQRGRGLDYFSLRKHYSKTKEERYFRCDIHNKNVHSKRRSLL